MILPQLVVMSQSYWPICRFRWGTDNAARVNMSRNAIISSETWMTRKVWRRYCDLKKIESSVAWSVPSSATIFIITVVKICFGLTRCYQVSPQHFDDSVNLLNWFRQNIKVCGRVVEALWLLFVFSSTRWIKVQEVQPQFPSRNPLPNQRFRE